MEPLLERIRRGEVLTADGAMGSLLMSRAGDLIRGRCPEYINLSRTDILEEVASLYLNAGADIVQTNTFGGSPLKLSDYSLDERTEEINTAAVKAVRNAVEDRAYVSASCGPTGKMLKPYGQLEQDEMAENFERQLKAVIGAGADIVCVETMTDLQEAVLAVRAAKSVNPSIPVMATMTFDKTPRGFFTMMGVSIEKAAVELEAAGADVIGSNCGNGIENMILIASELHSVSSMPLIIQSNAGLPEIRGVETVYPETPEFMADKSRELVAAGVSIVGGCCGTTPEHISAISRTIRSL